MIITPQPQNNLTTQPQNTQQNLQFLETNSPTSDSCDESPTTQTNIQDTSSTLKRPPTPSIPTTRTLHIPDPDSVLQYIGSCSHKIPTATKTQKIFNTNITKKIYFTIKKSVSNENLPEYTTYSPSELGSFTFLQLYPKLERLKSTTAPSLPDLYYKDKDSDSTAITRVPRYSYNLRSQQRRLSQELSSLTSSSTKSRLVRQQAQPRSETPSLSFTHPTIPSSLSLPFQVTSGFESASFISEDLQIISNSRANFSRIYSPSSIRSDSSIQLPE